MKEASLDRRRLLAAGASLGVGAVPAMRLQRKPHPLRRGTASRRSHCRSIRRRSRSVREALVSHHDNNYVGAVKRLGAITAQFASLDPSTAPGFDLNGLKREELIAWNSMILHELYFEGFGTATAPAAPLARAIERDFGSFDRWSAEFAGMGKAPAGGSGWVLLTWSRRDNCLVNQWSADHTMTLAGATPILALDIYEHAYAIDYGAKAGAYVDAYMKVIDWRDAAHRFKSFA